MLSSLTLVLASSHTLRRAAPDVEAFQDFVTQFASSLGKEVS